MATVVLNAGATDMTVAGNYTGGVGPSAGDVVQIREGSQTITVGPSVNLNMLEVGPNFRGAMNATVSCASGTTPTIKLGGNTSSIVLTAGASNVTTIECAQLAGEVHLQGGTFTNAKFYRGRNYVEGAATATTAFNFGADTTLYSGAGATTTLHNMAGLTRSKRALTTATIGGRSTLIVNDSGTIATANVTGDAALVLQATDPTAPTNVTCTSVNLYDRATLTPNGALASMTITNLTIFGAETKPILRSGPVKITATNTTNHPDIGTFSDPAGGGGGVFLGVTGL